VGKRKESKGIMENNGFRKEQGDHIKKKKKPKR
jgi:hypothetical protein